jgi:CheY-like chemotaxis protein
MRGRIMTADDLGTQARTERALQVLVVDDNHDAADTLGVLLHLWGHDHRVAYDGAVALEAACVYRPDCLVTDLALPGMDGLTLAQRIRQQPGLEKIKLVASTAFSDEFHARRVKEAGFDYYLVKPADLVELERVLHMIQEVIRLTGKTEELARQNVALATETKELLKEVKEDITEVKEELKEFKEEVRELKEELRETKDGEPDAPGSGPSVV